MVQAFSGDAAANIIPIEDHALDDAEMPEHLRIG